MQRLPVVGADAAAAPSRRRSCARRPTSSGSRPRGVAAPSGLLQIEIACRSALMRLAQRSTVEREAALEHCELCGDGDRSRPPARARAGHARRQVRVPAVRAAVRARGPDEADPGATCGASTARDLGVPVDMAFVVRVDGAAKAYYPSPVGPTESLLAVEPAVELADDVEALLQPRARRAGWSGSTSASRSSGWSARTGAASPAARTSGASWTFYGSTGATWPARRAAWAPAATTRNVATRRRASTSARPASTRSASRSTWMPNLRAMIELGFSVEGAARVEHAAVPTLRFALGVSSRGAGAVGAARRAAADRRAPARVRRGRARPAVRALRAGRGLGHDAAHAAVDAHDARRAGLRGRRRSSTSTCRARTTSRSRRRATWTRCPTARCRSSSCSAAASSTPAATASCRRRGCRGRARRRTRCRCACGRRRWSATSAARRGCGCRKESFDRLSAYKSRNALRDLGRRAGGAGAMSRAAQARRRGDVRGLHALAVHADAR